MIGAVLARRCRLCRELFTQLVHNGRPYSYCRACRAGRWDTRAGRPRKFDREEFHEVVHVIPDSQQASGG